MRAAEVHWYEATGIGRREYKIKYFLDWAMKKSKFVICIDNSDYPASLETRKIYEAIPDTEAALIGQIRVIDESGEDYLFPETCFIDANLSKEIRAAIVKAA